MIPGTLNSEIHVAQIEIQNEIKTLEIKKPVNNIVTSVNYSELLRQENAKECESKTEIIKDINRDTGDSKAQECGFFFTDSNLNKMEKGYKNIKKKGHSRNSRKPGGHPTKYWVQYEWTAELLEYTPELNSFVAKVLIITFLMLLITSIFVLFVYLSNEMRELFTGSLGKMLAIGGTVVMLILNYAVMCSPCIRIYPCNCIILIIPVICMSLIAAYVTALYRSTLVFYALITTSVFVFVCFLLALTSFDFTKYTLYIASIAVVFFVLTSEYFIVQVITGTSINLLVLIILVVGVNVNVVVITMELQLILGGKTVILSEDDYAMGAYMLYTSIIDLFLKILQFLGMSIDEDSDFFSFFFL